jgi:2,3-bisphosphoglycerate-independent phosphoglycerate mutase
MPRPVVIVLLDGLGDRAGPAHGGETANERAATPVLDAFAARGSSGLLHALGPGRAPSSEVAHWAMLGYRAEEFPGRAVLEAVGRGQDVDPADVLAYAALRPADRRQDALWVTGRARSPQDDADAAALLAAVGERTHGGLTFRLSPAGSGEATLRISGGASDQVTDSDPFLRDVHPVLRPRALEPAATRTADAAAAWSREVVRILAGHPVNAARSRRGAAPLGVVTLKWWGRRRPGLPSFALRHGLDGVLIGASPFLAGLADVLGLRAVGAVDTGDPAADLAERLELAAGLLGSGCDFVLCHLKATDEAGHTKRPEVKRATIERLDPVLAHLAGDPFGAAVVCVTGDHATPTDPEMIHSGDPVPLLLAGPGVRRDGTTRFGELFQARGILGRLDGEDLMPVLLNAAGRPRFLGSRAVPDAHAQGLASEVEPLDAGTGAGAEAAASPQDGEARPSPDGAPALSELVGTGGCAAKLDARRLGAALAGLAVARDDALLLGLGDRDDAAVYRLGEDAALVLTVDFAPAVLADPRASGAVAAVNALNDVYAVGGRPRLCLNVVGVPADRVPPAYLPELLAGAEERVTAAGAMVVGGHTIRSSEPLFGLAVAGFAAPAAVWSTSGARPGDALVLTKPIGAGVLLSAARREAVSAELLGACVRSLTLLHDAALAPLAAASAHAVTDVSGFGLAGHAADLAGASGVDIELFPGRVPCYDGAAELTAAGWSTSITDDNRRGAASRLDGAGAVAPALEALLHDPQTSGGLLAAVPADRARALVGALRAAGYADAAVIGAVAGHGLGRVRLREEPRGGMAAAEPPPPPAPSVPAARA